MTSGGSLVRAGHAELGRSGANLHDLRRRDADAAAAPSIALGFSMASLSHLTSRKRDHSATRYANPENVIPRHL